MADRRRAALVGTALLAVVVVAAACGGDDGGGSVESGATVDVEAFAFEPDPVEVEAGTTIRFVNHDAIDHTVTAGTREAPAPERFDGQLPEEGATFDLVLDEPGTYEYFCEIHPGPGMTASIVVR